MYLAIELIVDFSPVIKQAIAVGPVGPQVMTANGSESKLNAPSNGQSIWGKRVCMIPETMGSRLETAGLGGSQFLGL
jgi:hypothetical protein